MTAFVPVHAAPADAALEIEAGRAARTWLDVSRARAAGRGRPIPPPAGRGDAGLPGEDRRFFEDRIGTDLSRIRIHAGRDDERMLRRLGASAAAHGGDIWLRAHDLHRPVVRRHVLAHEVAHLLQPAVAGGRVYGRSVEDWISGSPDIRSWGYTALLSEIDELVAWQERQTRSSLDSARIDDSLAELRREVARRDRETRSAGRARPRPRGGRDPELPARRPRVLDEPTSRAYADPAEMRSEYDLIMVWLARRDIPRAERRMLEIERDNLAPQFASDRTRVAGEQRVARLQAALTPSDRDAGHELLVAARVISGIARDDANANVYYIYQDNERIAISAEQAARVRGEIDRQLRRAYRMIDGDAEQSWDTYQSQLAVNRESPIIAAIAGWLGGATDPGPELLNRRARLIGELRAYNAELGAGNIVAAAGRLASLERQAQVIHGVAAAFRDRHIEGAERAVGALEITRDVSFAVAGSIAAVLAAPVVAGAVAGAGLTGGAATVATIGGTGLVVGTGEAVVRGGSSAGGVLVAGGSAHEAGQALVGEGRRGFLDGFMAGAGGGAARVLGPALGVGGQVGSQVLRRAAAEAIVNGTSSMVDALIHGARPGDAVAAGLRAAALAVPGAVVGGANSRVVRELGGPLAAGAAAYGGAIMAGQSRDEALRAAAVAVTTTVVMSRVQHGAEAEQRLEARGRSIGEALVRPAAPAAGTAAPRTGIRVELEPSAPRAAASPTVDESAPSAAELRPATARTPTAARAATPAPPPPAVPAAHEATVGPALESTAPTHTAPAGTTVAAPAAATPASPSADHPAAPVGAAPVGAAPVPEAGTAPGSAAATATPGPGAPAAQHPPGPGAPGSARGNGVIPDDVIDGFVARLDEPQPFDLNIGAQRRRDIVAGRRDFALDQPVRFDVDEPAAVGSRGISRAEALRRATDPGNRQLLDPATNQRTKYLGEEVRPGGPRPSATPVSLADQPSAVFTRRFDEVTELRQVFDEAVARARIRPGMSPTAVKAAINDQVRELIGRGQSPAARAVRGALTAQGFEYVPNLGIVAVRRTP